MASLAPRQPLVFALAFLLAACTTQVAPSAPITVDPERELVITDEPTLAELGDGGARGPLSFRAALEGLDDDAGAVTLAWLRGWSTRLRDEGTPARAAALDAVTCAWLHLTPANACDDGCASCAHEDLDLARAPFRLAAVVNRTDLAEQPDRAGEAGEARLVFELARGLDAEPLEVIFEYAQRGDAHAWATRWHALRDVTYDAFPTALAALVGHGVVARGRTTLARVRTADTFTDRTRGVQLRMDELAFDRAARALVPVRLRNTVDWARVPQSEVEAFLDREATALARGTALFPSAWWASSVITNAGAAPPTWLARAKGGDLLAGATCTGCHARTRRGFQIEPGRHGRARLSTLLADTSRDGEMTRRTVFLQLTLSEAAKAH